MDFHGFHFANPVWLWGLPALPLAALALFLASRAKHSTFFLGNPRMVDMASSPFTSQLIPPVLRLVILALFLIAAARPQAGQKKVEEKKPVTDLFVVLDVSGSMTTNDLQPSRIVAAKKLLGEFVDKVQNVRMGLTIFARYSFTQCPLTTDIGLVKQLLATVEPAPYSIKWDGTAIGDAIISSLNRLKNGSGKAKDAGTQSPSLVSKFFNTQDESEEDKPNSRAIVLLTDGGDNASQIHPLNAAKVAAAQGVRIYTIGVGGKKPVLAMGRYPDGHIGPFIDQNTGQWAIEPGADLGLLGEMARITGGKSYAATDNRSLEQILGDIAKLEKRDVSVTSHWEYQELASFFLLAAFILLAMDLGLETTVLRTLP